MLVIGGGRSGGGGGRGRRRRNGACCSSTSAAAFEADGYEVLAPARAIGIYEGGLVPVDAGDVLYRFRAERIVVATGALEQPLVFPGNDLVGVMLPGAVRRLVDDWAIKPGNGGRRRRRRAPASRSTDQLQRAGAKSPTSSTSAQPRRAAPAHGHARPPDGVVVDGREIDCDLLVISGGRQPAYSLLAQAGARIEFERGPRHLRARRAARRGGSGRLRRRGSGACRVPPPSYGGRRGDAASSASARTSPRRT